MYRPVFLLSLALFSCGHGDTDEAEKGARQEPARTAVTLTQISYGSISSETVYPATTAYLSKYALTSPMAAYVKRSLAVQGMRVKSGQTLFLLENREQHFIGSAPVLEVKAMESGVVLDAPVPSGGFVTDGSALCTIASGNSLVFEINVPAEQSAAARGRRHCTIELPDGQRLRASVLLTLAVMNTASQSACVVAKASAPFLPEGMRVRAIFADVSPRGMVVARSAVQSDEGMREHWLFRLASDGTAQRVSVDVGNSNADSIEIRSSELSPRDLIILTGGYGLADGARVKVEKR